MYPVLSNGMPTSAMASSLLPQRNTPSTLSRHAVGQLELEARRDLVGARPGAGRGSTVVTEPPKEKRCAPSSPRWKRRSPLRSFQAYPVPPSVFWLGVEMNPDVIWW